MVYRGPTAGPMQAQSGYIGLQNPSTANPDSFWQRSVHSFQLHGPLTVRGVAEVQRGPL